MSTPKKITDDLLEEFDWLVVGGVDPEDAARRVGVTLAGIERHQQRLRREAQRGDAA